MFIFGNGGGLATMIPVHLSLQGIEPAKIGLLFSFLYFGIGSAGILAGRMVDRFHWHKPLSLISAAGEILIGIFLLQAKSFPIFAIVLFLSWFLAGIHAAVVSSLVALQAKETERGRVFGMLGLFTGLGAVLSGFLYGKVMDVYGFESLLVINLVIAMLWTILSLFYKKPLASVRMKESEDKTKSAKLAGAFYCVVLAAVLSWISINGGKLGISLVMTDLKFSSADISLTVGVASLAALTIPLFLGWFSDFIGRIPILLGLSLLGAIGLFLISNQRTLAGFCMASTLLTLNSSFSSLSNALITDMVPKESIGFALALINSSSYIAGIFSSAMLGFSMKTLGPSKPFLLAIVFPLASAILFASLARKNIKFMNPAIRKGRENLPI